jgi:hypothetical protein
MVQWSPWPDGSSRGYCHEAPIELPGICTGLHEPRSVLVNAILFGLAAFVAAHRLPQATRITVR